MNVFPKLGFPFSDIIYTYQRKNFDKVSKTDKFIWNDNIPVILLVLLQQETEGGGGALPHLVLVVFQVLWTIHRLFFLADYYYYCIYLDFNRLWGISSILPWIAHSLTQLAFLPTAVYACQLSAPSQISNFTITISPIQSKEHSVTEIVIISGKNIPHIFAKVIAVFHWLQWQEGNSVLPKILWCFKKKVACQG